MNALAEDVGQQASALEVDGLRLLPTSLGFAAAIAQAYGRRRRPRCLCRPEGIEMYIARLADGYVVKRMPETGERHAPACSSYEPPTELSGIRPLLGSAIREDPSTGMTMLKLGFSLSKRPAHPCPSRAASAGSTVTSSSARLSLRALLHYLWERAELTRWHPGFEGRRGWGVVRRQLLQAASQMYACGDTLLTRLDVPEPFAIDQQEAISARRQVRWAAASGTAEGTRAMQLLIAEIKAIVPARHGHKAVIKHVPDVGFALEDSFFRQIKRRFEQELALWSASDGTHLIVIATVWISSAGLPRIAELSLMTVTSQWLPVEDMVDAQLVRKLVRDRRSFSKVLRYDQRQNPDLPSLVLTDEPGSARAVFRSDWSFGS